MSMDVESARRDWQDAYRRLEQESSLPGGASESLWRQLEIVAGELHRKVGSRFTLRDLAAEYGTSERWVRNLVSERAAAPGWPRTLSMVEGAAFHVYSRGAEDYEP